MIIKTGRPAPTKLRVCGMLIAASNPVVGAPRGCSSLQPLLLEESSIVTPATAAHRARIRRVIDVVAGIVGTGVGITRPAFARGEAGAVLTLGGSEVARSSECGLVSR